MGDSSKTPQILEPEDQTLVNLDANTGNSEGHHDVQDDPPPQTEAKTSDAMDTKANSMDNLNSPSSILLGNVVISKKNPTHTQDHGDAYQREGRVCPRTLVDRKRKH